MNIKIEELLMIVRAAEVSQKTRDLAGEELMRRLTPAAVKTEERDEKSEGGKLFTEKDMESAFGKGFYSGKNDRASSATWQDHYNAFKGYYYAFPAREKIDEGKLVVEKDTKNAFFDGY